VAPAATGAQRPTKPGRLQAWQVAVHAPSQQTPSAQKPLPQSAGPVQLPPLGFLFWAQVPALQYCIGPAQGVVAPRSCWPRGITVQVPGEAGRSQAWQVPAQALLQHTPSMQKRLTHWAGAVHGSPLALPASTQIGRA